MLWQTITVAVPPPLPATEDMHMTDPTHQPDTGAGPDRGSPPRTPRWVKVSAIVVGVLILVVVAVALISDRDHGPGRHRADGDTRPGSVTEQLPGGHG